MAPRGEALKGRLMLNGDNCTFFYNPELWNPEGGRYGRHVIHRYVQFLKDAGVDTFLICPNTQVPWYPSKTLPYLHQHYTRGDKEYWRDHLTKCENLSGEALERQLINKTKRFSDLFLDLQEDGVDWLEETSLACRERGIAPFLSVRMNDSHGGTSPTGSLFNNALMRDPENLLDKPSIDPELTWERYSLDFDRAECRDYMTAMIAELLRDYDFDGLELDFNRDPVIVKPIATDEQRAAIAVWMREIRALADERQQRTGKPFYLGLKVPFALPLLYDYGLDVDALIREGLFDFVSMSNYFQTSWDAPIDDYKARWEQYTQVLGVIEGMPNWLRVADKDGGTAFRPTTASPELVRGNAAGKLVLGADSLMLFNSFFDFDQVPDGDSPWDCLRDLQHLDALRGRDKAYTMCTSAQYPRSMMAIERDAPFPHTFQPSTSRTFRLPMIKEPQDMRLRVQLVLDRTDTAPRFAVSLNGRFPAADGQPMDTLLFASGAYDRLLPAHRGVVFDLDASLLTDGWNDITVYNLAWPRADAAHNAAHTHCLRSLEIGLFAPAERDNHG